MTSLATPCFNWAGATTSLEGFRTAAVVDKEISRLNVDAPDGEHRRLRGVELEARGLTHAPDHTQVEMTLHFLTARETQGQFWLLRIGQLGDCRWSAPSRKRRRRQMFQRRKQ